MRQMTKIIRKVDVLKEQLQGNDRDIDYELASLFSAMEKDDKQEMEKCKRRLKELVQEKKELEAKL